MVDVNARSSMNGTGNKSKKGPDWQLVFLGGKKLLQVVSNVRFLVLATTRGSDPKNNGSIICFSKTKGTRGSRDHLVVEKSSKTQFPFYYSYNCWWCSDGFSLQQTTVFEILSKKSHFFANKIASEASFNYIFALRDKFVWLKNETFCAIFQPL